MSSGLLLPNVFEAPSETLKESLVRLLEERQAERARDEAKHGAFIRRCQGDVNEMIEAVFTRENGEPIKQYDSHRELQAFLDSGQRLVVHGQAGWGKTTQLAGKILHLLGNNPSLRIIYASARYTLATEQIEVVKNAIQSSEILHRIFPDLRPRIGWNGKQSLWQEDRFRIQGNDSRDPSCRGIGLDKAVGGARADLIIVDDPHELKTARTRAGRIKTLQTLRQGLFSRVTPETRIWVVSNAWHKEDAAFVLAALPEWKHRVWPASGMLMPDIWTKEKLAEQEKAIGTVAYQRMYECKPLTTATEMIPEADIRACIQKGLPMQLDPYVRHRETTVHGEIVWRLDRGPGGNPVRFEEVTVGLDPATVSAGTDDEDHDRYGIHILGVHPETGNIRTLYAESGHLNTPGLLERLLRLQAAFDPDNGIWVESNGQQMHLIDMARDKITMQARCEALGLDENIPWDMRICSHQTDSGKYDPNVGIPGIAIDFQARVWELPDPAMEPEIESLIEAACSFAFEGKHTPDELMAAWIARRAVRTSPRPTVEVV